MSKVTFNNKNNPFFKSLKEKVDKYFTDKNIHTAGNRRLYLKSAFQVSLAIVTYVILVFFTPSIPISILLCCLLGINLGVIGFNVMHEGGHNSFSRHKWLNVLSGHFLNLMGGNIHFWKLKHNINHHTYTNIEGMDSDIDIQPFMRLHDNQPRYWFHKFQHVYWVFLYGISYFVWVFYEDYVKYFTRRVSKNSEARDMSLREHFIFWITKIVYVTLYLVLPIMFVGLLDAIIGYGIIVFSCGLSISIVFQLAHVVEATDFPLPTHDSNKIETEWAIHQINTTANFATKNPVICWLLGGLNFQVEHHLFPKISHVHYPQISLLVKETCDEFNIDYLEYPTLTKAFYSHLNHIKRLGQTA
ncbi:MAG TPA: acyl-CoA desaturase [Cytophagaceae bacterium]|jgi:linoleoyl-CoA desaturase